MTTRIGLVGDYNADVPAHQAIPRALALAESALGVPLEFRWLPTETIESDAALAPFDALWTTPLTRRNDGRQQGPEHVLADVARSGREAEVDAVRDCERPSNEQLDGLAIVPGCRSRIKNRGC